MTPDDTHSPALPGATYSAEDRALGLDRPILRRDFINGIGATLGALGAQTLLPWGQAHAQTSGFLPRGTVADTNAIVGQTAEAFKTMHALRSNPQPVGTGKSTGEHFDLVVIGAGLSGLAAAHEFRRLKPGASVLLLDPLADVGGHAKRNEFTVDGHKLIGYGGSEALQTPSFFSPAVKALMSDLGIEPTKFEQYFDREWFGSRGMDGEVIYFDPQVWGRLAVVTASERAAEWVPKTPLHPQAQADLIRLLDEPQDYWPGLSSAQKRERLAGMTYREYLLGVARVDPQVALLYQDATKDYFGIGTDALSALDAWVNELPGFAGLRLDEGADKDKTDARLAPTSRLVRVDPDDYIYHFPDGNATVARALVRRLIPQAMPAQTTEDVATGNLRYAQLDVPGQPVRIRLGSTAVKVRHLGDPAKARQVEVTYARDEGLHAVVAGHVVFACWHRVIPYLTEEISDEQAEALSDQVKAPLAYATVALRNSRAFQRLGISRFTAPGSQWITNFLDYPVSIGSYRYPQSADEPVLLHMVHVPSGEVGQDTRTQFNVGRRKMLATSFSDYERQIRRQLNEILGPGGFDAARDIAAITINRWGHGYSYEYGRPDDTFWPRGPLPIETARRGWGRIAIANSDSAASAYAHSAMEQGIRASRELLGGTGPAITPFPGPPESELQFYGDE